MKNNQIAGYVAGIVTGVTYGLNPLFAVPLMNAGANVESILFFRYSLAVVLLGLWLLIMKQSFKISGRQAVRLLILGLLFTASSLCLFEAYKYIPSGLATTIVFLYPVLVAPQQRKAKQRKILIFNENRDFLFSPKTQKSAVRDRLWWSKRWSKRVFQISPP